MKIRSIILILGLLVLGGATMSVSPQRGDKKKKGNKEVDPMVAFREEVAGYRAECKAALKPYRYSFGRTTFFNYKGYNTMKEVEVSLMLNATYKFAFNAQGVTQENIGVKVYNRPSDYNKRIMLYEKKGVGGGSFHFTSNQLFENLRKHYREKGMAEEELEKLLLTKVYIDYIIPAVDVDYEEDLHTGRKKAVIKKGAIVFASGYENLEAR